MSSTVHLDELDRVVGAATLLSPTYADDGGEWDPLRALPTRTRRRLAGAGYLTSYGERPDVFAELIVDRVAGIETVDDALDWYVRTSLRAIDERRRQAHRTRHLRTARQHGAASYYEHRTNVARFEHGFRSLWHYRKAKGWT